MEDLKKLVAFDELTGSYSRRRELEAGDCLFKSSLRFDSNMSVLMMDIDHFGRLGGKEFLVVLPHSSLHDGIKVAVKLRCSVSGRNFLVDGKSLSISVSIGVAELRDHENFTRLIQEADEQLYRAKSCGRDQFCPAGSAI